jgi:D-cysteine desulfhydrase
MSTSDNPVPLFDRYPNLMGALPRHPIVHQVSPVQRLARLEAAICSRVALWVKRDDGIGTRYGGNKPRKLEFLLGHCLARGTHAIVTFGGLGSNHGVATAIYAGELGIAVHLCLVDQPLTSKVRQTLGQMLAHGAHLHYAPGRGRLVIQAGWLMARLVCRRPWRPPMLIMPGGSTPLGTVGIVNAAFELAGQVEAGKMPRPAAVFVALGSSGTHAGLVAGFRLLGWDVPVIGVRVSDALPLSPHTVARLANRTLALLNRHDPNMPCPRVQPREVIVQEGYLGQGYGYPTAAGASAARVLEETEGITLDECYTAKAMAALLDAAITGQYNGPLLFWHTYNSHPLPPLAPGWEAKLPPNLRALR